MKSRELERQMLEDGCVLERKDGDHHVWRLPNGRTMIVPVGGKHSEAKSYLRSKYRRLMREERRSGAQLVVSLRAAS